MKQTSGRIAARRARRSGAGVAGRVGVAPRVGVALASVGLLFGLSACGFNAQTLQPYTPSDGVNVDIGLDQNENPTAATVKVRNLMVISKAHGSGFLSATLVSGEDDKLTEVSGQALGPDGTTGSKLTTELSEPVEITAGQPVVLTDQSPITLTAADLKPGQLADLTLSFERSGSYQVEVPVVDGNNEIYSGVEPTPEQSPGQL